MRRNTLHVPLIIAGWLSVAPLWGATFGTPVSIGGQASDLALDEARGQLYIANFTANRIDVMSLADNTVRTSMNVAPQPGSLALSPDGRYLVVTHYGVWQAPGTNKDALTIIDLSDNTRRTFSMSSTPLGVAFGADGMALLITTTDLLLLDPGPGTMRVITTTAELAATALPAEPGITFPPNIVATAMATSGDGLWIYGLADLDQGGVMRFRYDVYHRRASAFGFTSTPTMGPRAIASNRDGSSYMTGWGLFNSNGDLVSEFPGPDGKLNVGGLVFHTDAGLIYGQIPEAGSTDPLLLIMEMDNLTVRERLRLPENLAGKSLLNAAGDVMYAISDSGVMVLPVGSLNRYPRLGATAEDLVFRGNFCEPSVMTQDMLVVDPGGGNTDFTITASGPGVLVTPESGMTPAIVRVQIDPAAFQTQNGTTTLQLAITSGTAVNIPAPVRLLVNNRNPDQRGTFINVPGKLVDLVADPVRNRFYVLRQDRNQVLVFDGSTYSKVATLRTYNTPTQMAVTFDHRYLLVGHNDSQLVAMFDLDTLEAQYPIAFPFGHYPRSIAASGKAVLGMSRLSDGTGTIDRADLVMRRATQLPTLGIFVNKLNVNTVLVGSPNGASVLAAGADGTVLAYNSAADTFVVSRKDVTLLAGPYAASSYDTFVVGNSVLNSSLVPIRTLESGTGQPSGFVFVDQDGFRSTAPSDTSPGTIQRVHVATGESVRPTRMVESPLLPPATPTITEGPFTRTLAALYNRSALISLTTSGFTVLAWEYDTAVAPPHITSVVNAADLTLPVAPGGLITVFGSQFSPTNLATQEMPLPTALGESCLTANGLAVPMLFISPGQINAQVPFSLEGNVVLVLHTPGGVSDNFNFTIVPTAPSVFRSGTAGPMTGIPTVVRALNNELVTPTNPIHPKDVIVIYTTGLGRTDPPVETGMPAPYDPLARTIVPVEVTLGGVPLGVFYAGLSPGLVGVYQVNATVPTGVPLGLAIPLQITQGGSSTTLNVRVVK
jgi:uncharacterized protein (TIGR03437 family)